MHPKNQQAQTLFQLLAPNMHQPLRMQLERKHKTKNGWACLLAIRHASTNRTACLLTWPNHPRIMHWWSGMRASIKAGSISRCAGGGWRLNKTLHEINELPQRIFAAEHLCRIELHQKSPEPKTTGCLAVSSAQAQTQLWLWTGSGRCGPLCAIPCPQLNGNCLRCCLAITANLKKWHAPKSSTNNILGLWTHIYIYLQVSLKHNV